MLKLSSLFAGLGFIAVGWGAALIDVASERRKLMDVDVAFSRETAERGLEGFLSYFADDATIFPSNAPIVSGKTGIRAHYARAFSAPGFMMSWKPVRADLAESGEMGYTYGTFEISTRDTSGRQVSRSGKYCTIWRKQSDGSWKIIVDIGNSGDTPMSPPSRESTVEIV